MKHFTLALFVCSSLACPLVAQTPSNTYYVTGVSPGDTLNVRSSPTQTARVVTRLPNGTTGIEIEGDSVFNGADEWVPISVAGTEGWVRSSYLASGSILRAQPSNIPSTPNSVAEESEASRVQTQGDRETHPDPVTTQEDQYQWVKPAATFALILAGAMALDGLLHGGSPSPPQNGEDSFLGSRDMNIAAEEQRRREVERAAERAERGF